MNKEWHEKHRIRPKATAKDRLAWHLEHQEHCQCRPIRKSLLGLLDVSSFRLLEGLRHGHG